MLPVGSDALFSQTALAIRGYDPVWGHPSLSHTHTLSWRPHPPHIPCWRPMSTPSSDGLSSWSAAYSTSPLPRSKPNSTSSPPKWMLLQSVSLDSSLSLNQPPQPINLLPNIFLTLSIFLQFHHYHASLRHHICLLDYSKSLPIGLPAFSHVHSTNSSSRMNFSKCDSDLIIPLFKALWWHPSTLRLKIKIVNKANRALGKIVLTLTMYPSSLCALSPSHPSPQPFWSSLSSLNLPCCLPQHDLCTCWSLNNGELFPSSLPLPLAKSWASFRSHLKVYFLRKSTLTPTPKSTSESFLICSHKTTFLFFGPLFSGCNGTSTSAIIDSWIFLY